jgi:hypothetical protein
MTATTTEQATGDRSALDANGESLPAIIRTGEAGEVGYSEVAAADEEMVKAIQAQIDELNRLSVAGRLADNVGPEKAGKDLYAAIVHAAELEQRRAELDEQVVYWAEQAKTHWALSDAYGGITEKARQFVNAMDGVPVTDRLGEFEQAG